MGNNRNRLRNLGMANQIEYDIVVVGAGPVGLAFTCMMRDSGYRILVLEAGQLPTYNNREYDLRVNSINLSSEYFLESVDVWDSVVAKKASQFDWIKVWSATSSEIEFRADEIDQQHLGHIVESVVLTTSLLEKIGETDAVQVMPESVIESIENRDSQVCIQLVGGQAVRCSLVVGADGAKSTVRQLVGIQTHERSYRQNAIVARVRVEKPVYRTAFQVFLETGPLAFLPLADGSYSIVWSCESECAGELRQLDDGSFGYRLTEAIENRLGNVHLIGERVSFLLGKLTVSSYLANRVVLIGDAAHVIHPLAGMGVNLGLMDAAALGEIMIERARNYEDCDPWNYSIFRKYERWRKAANIPVGLMMDGFDQGFRNPFDIIKKSIGFGFEIANRTQLFKRGMIRFACGLSGDLPVCAKRE